MKWNIQQMKTINFKGWSNKIDKSQDPRTMFGEGILNMEFVYNDDFILHLSSAL